MRNITRNPWLYILVSVPFVLYGAMLILPTFDDWYSLTAPKIIYDGSWTQFFLPYGVVWRPFDALVGFILSTDYRMCPTFNHAVIVAGHVLNTLIVYKICRALKFNHTATSMATVFFYASPCMLGTVLSCDSFNQTYSNFWGLVALWSYLTHTGKRRYAMQAACIILATLCKENGIAWLVVPPIMRYAFKDADWRQLAKGVAFGLAVAAVYFAVRLSLPKTEIINPEYSNFALTKKVRDLCVALGYTWFAVDWIAVFHEQSRNIAVAAATLLLSLPLVYVVFFRDIRRRLTLRFAAICLCILAVWSPNLVITMSVMNVYSGLGMAALLVGYAVNAYKPGDRMVKTAFALYLVSAIPVGIHHWYKAWQTSLAGKQMAIDAQGQIKEPADSLFTITIKEDERKFSSFCVLPSDAFADGMALQYENGYKWPRAIDSNYIEREGDYMGKAMAMARKALASKKFGCAIIVDKDKVTVVQ